MLLLSVSMAAAWALMVAVMPASVVSVISWARVIHGPLLLVSCMGMPAALRISSWSGTPMYLVPVRTFQ